MRQARRYGVCAALFLLGLSAESLAVTHVSCGHPTRLPSIEVTRTDAAETVKIHGGDLRPFVRDLGFEVPSLWQGFVRAVLPAGSCYFSKEGHPIANCHRGNLTHTIFTVVNPDGTVVGERAFDHIAIDLHKDIEIRAGYNQGDDRRESFVLGIDMDWQTSRRVRLSAVYAPSTCKVQ